MSDAEDKNLDYDFYRNKVILAPMVRVSRYAFRLLCLDYGADLVYSDEIIDSALLVCEKKENNFISTESGAVLFRTSQREKNKGSKSPEKALLAAKMVEDYVAGIDLNMGCPKPFSTKGGRGSALMNDPETAKKVLLTLQKNLKIPVTCKIRVFNNLEQTLELVKVLLKSNISAIAIHGRTAKEDYTYPNREDFIRSIKEISDIPVIANGLSSHKWLVNDLKKYKEVTNADSIMIARKAGSNPSIFSSKYEDNIDMIIPKYLEYAKLYESNLYIIKYIVSKMIKHNGNSTRDIDKVIKAENLLEILDMWSVQHPPKEFPVLINKENTIGSISEFQKIGNTVTLPVVLRNLKRYPQTSLPKLVLNQEMLKKRFPLPKYEHTNEGKRFKTSIEIDGVVYSSSLANTSKKLSDNAAALVYLKMKEALI